MKWVLGYFGFQILVLLILVILSWLFWDKRVRRRHGLKVPDGFLKTEEVNIDPVDGKRWRVFYNPTTGERYYLEEKEN